MTRSLHSRLKRRSAACAHPAHRPGPAFARVAGLATLCALSLSVRLARQSTRPCGPRSCCRGGGRRPRARASGGRRRAWPPSPSDFGLANRRAPGGSRRRERGCCGHRPEATQSRTSAASISNVQSSTSWRRPFHARVFSRARVAFDTGCPWANWKMKLARLYPAGRRCSNGIANQSGKNELENPWSPLS